MNLFINFRLAFFASFSIVPGGGNLDAKGWLFYCLNIILEVLFILAIMFIEIEY